MRRGTTESFIAKSVIVHGAKYDYSMAIYNGNKMNVQIICLEHGIFEQSPNSHLKGRGCPTCGLTQRAKSQSSIQSFIKKASETHNYIYDYSLVQYKNTHTKVKIICPTHGIFEQSPAFHLNGGGCRKCATEKNQQQRRSTTEEFINKAILIHGNTYDYSLSKYINSRNKIKIICPKHGIFEQIPTSHLSGVGCSECSESKGETKVTEFLNKNNINFIPQKTFDGCTYKRKLKFDFYLPEYNMCIEFNGIQHYKANEYFGGIKAFNEQIKKDNIKYNYCLNNNICLFVIKYDDDLNTKLNALLNLI